MSDQAGKQMREQGPKMDSHVFPDSTTLETYSDKDSDILQY